MSRKPSRKRRAQTKKPPTRKITKPRRVKRPPKEGKAVQAPAKPPPKREEPAKPKLELKNLLVAIRLRGESAVPFKVQETLLSLRLKKKYNAVILPERPDIRGMLRQAKDMLAWGTPSAEALSQLIECRAKTTGDKPITVGFLKSKLGLDAHYQLVEKLASGGLDLQTLWSAGVKPVLRLHPPRGGFKMSTRRLYQERGELGDRGKEIDLLLRKMR